MIDIQMSTILRFNPGPLPCLMALLHLLWARLGRASQAFMHVLQGGPFTDNESLKRIRYKNILYYLYLFIYSFISSFLSKSLKDLEIELLRRSLHHEVKLAAPVLPQLHL